MGAILTVDDSIVTIMKIEDIVKAHMDGVRILKATNAEEAEQLVDSTKEPLLLAIIDYNMQGIDGLTLMDRLHTKRKIPYEKMVLLTANNSADIKKSTFDKKAHFLLKPLTLASFQEILKKIPQS